MRAYTQQHLYALLGLCCQKRQPIIDSVPCSAGRGSDIRSIRYVLWFCGSLPFGSCTTCLHRAAECRSVGWCLAARSVCRTEILAILKS